MKKPEPTPTPPVEPPSRGPLWVVGSIGLILLLAGGVVFADWWSVVPDEVVASYVGRNKCAQCHPHQLHQWTGSHHDLAMDRATAESVLGDFNDASLEHEGMRSRMFRKDGKFFVNTEGPDGRMADFEVKYTFGHTPLQQYMVEFDRSADQKENEIARLQVLRISWDTEKKRWFYLPAPDVSDKLLPGDDLHWTGVAQRWNNMCADCHSTNVHKGFDDAKLVYKTTFSEIDVSCETCHGPGSVHVELAEARSLFWDRKRGFALAKLKSIDSNVQIETCAKCHSRRRVVYPDYRAGEDYHDHYAQELLQPQTYYCDGQILDEVFDYGSFIQSKMYHKHIRCTDCHDPHTTKLKHEGNKLCTSCHQHPLAKYDSPAHHQHKTDGTGGQCVECHMPHRTYMEVDPRRDHSLRAPRPDLSVEFGVPNACTQCHLDLNKFASEKRSKLKDYAGCLLAAQHGDAEVKTEIDRLNRWAAEKTAAWYPKNPAVTTPEPPLPSFAPAFAAAWAGKADAGAKLLEVVRNVRYPVMARASALAQLAYNDPVTLAAARRHLNDDSPELRALAIEHTGQRIGALQGSVAELRPQLDEYTAAFRELQARGTLDGPGLQAAAGQLEGLQRRIAAEEEELAKLVELVAAKLLDPVRWPRIEAGRALVSVSKDRLTDEQVQARTRALDDYRTGLLTDNDRAGAHVALGYLEEQLGDFNAAVERYRVAMRVEPQATGARTNLAALLERMAERLELTGKPDDAQHLRGEVQAYRQEEIALLTRDLRLLPNTAPLSGRSMLLYRIGMMAYLVGDYPQAEEKLLAAIQLQPESADLLYAYALFCQKSKQMGKAMSAVRRLLELQPENQLFQQLKRELQSSTPPAGPTFP